MYMKFLSMFAAMLFCITVPAAASNWVVIGGAENVTVKIDSDSIVPAGNGLTKAWVLFSYDVPQESQDYPKFNYQSLVVLDFFDCAERTYDGLYEVFYAGAERDGAVMKSKSYPKNKMNLTDVVPGSLAETALKFACGWNGRKSKK